MNSIKYFALLAWLVGGCTLSAQTWTGATSADWHTPSNWSTGTVPDGTALVMIENIGHDPVIGTETVALAKAVLLGSGTLLTIQAGASLNIDASASQGLIINATVDNFGTINIGSQTGTGSSGISGAGSCALNNHAGGQINIDRTGSFGIHLYQGSVSNAGQINIGSSANIGHHGIFLQRIGNFKPQFFNLAGSELNINRVVQGSHAINLITGNFSNAGLMRLGNLAGIGYVGINVTAASNFVNGEGGDIQIDRTILDAINIINGSSFANSGLIRIGSINDPSGYGIGISSGNSFVNWSSGAVYIYQNGLAAIINDGNFTNHGLIELLQETSTFGSIANYSSFNNNACAILRVAAKISNPGQISNAGLISLTTGLAHTNSGVVNNNGVLEYVQNNPIPGTVNNNDLIVKPVSAGCQAIPNALQIGGAPSFTPGASWYSDPDLTDAAGIYDLASNTFTADNLPEGQHILYFSVHDNANGCDRTVSIRVSFNDQSAPLVSCPANQTLTADADCAVPVGDWSLLSKSDNCAAAADITEVQSPAGATLLSGHNGQQTVTLTADDGNGNTNSCSFTITLQDLSAPVPLLSNLPDITLDCGGEPTAPQAVDNCAGLITGYTATEFPIAGPGNVTVTWTYNDGNGNTVDQTQQIVLAACDLDGDGYTSSAGDCDDDNPFIHPGADDNNCNEVDDDCDGEADNGGPDADCDGAPDVCDLCPGGDDSVDNNNDGLPDCKYPPAYVNIIPAWKCGNNKVSVCHNNKTKCYLYSALADHIAHGDYLGPCGNASCDGAREEESTAGRGDENLLHAVAPFLFPNPAAAEAWLDLSAYEGLACSVRLTDLRGVLVLDLSVPEAGHAPLRLNLSGLVSGLYFVQVKAEGESTQTLKLAVERR